MVYRKFPKNSVTTRHLSPEVSCLGNDFSLNNDEQAPRSFSTFLASLLRSEDLLD